MPVEIRELVIRAVVADTTESDTGADLRRGRGGSSPSEYSWAAAEASGVDQRAVIEECVRQVLSILRRSRER